MKRVIGWILKGFAFFTFAIIGLFFPLYLAAIVISGLVEHFVQGELPFSLHQLQWLTLLGLYALLFTAALILGAVLGSIALVRVVRRAQSRHICKRQGHAWIGYHCSRCGNVKPHEHIWDGCRCSLCGEIRDEGHVWVNEYCPRCNGTGYLLPMYRTSTSSDGLSYDDPDEQQPCGCAHPVERVCQICGKREDASEQK